MKDFLKFSQFDKNKKPNGNFIYINKNQIAEIWHNKNSQISTIATTICTYNNEYNCWELETDVLTKELEEQISLL